MSLTIRLLRDTTGDLSWDSETIIIFKVSEAHRISRTYAEEESIWVEPLRGQSEKVRNPSHISGFMSSLENTNELSYSWRSNAVDPTQLSNPTHQ